jgi:hypothetical protein
VVQGHWIVHTRTMDFLWLPETLRAASRRYAQLAGEDAVLREAPPGIDEFAAEGELVLQSRFFAGEFGDEWMTECGRRVRMLDPGMWNREAGPDFRNATVIFDGNEKCTGDLEIDIDSTSWETHGHAGNPDFENVILHCFFREGSRRAFARTRSNRSVPQVRLGPLVDGPKLSRSMPEPAQSLESALALVELAAQHRLACKARSLHLLHSLHGPQESLFHALAQALGFRHNSMPLTVLAQRCGYKIAASAQGEALLFGLAGFLEQPRPDSEIGRQTPYLVRLWKDWWKLREREQRLILPASAWKIGGNRPANHPHRRVAALHLVAGILPGLGKALESAEERLFASQLRGLQHPFWSSHWNLSARMLAGGKPVGLVGENRVRDILVNVFVPSLVARGKEAFDAWKRLVPGQIPARVRDVADWLLPGFPLEAMRSAACQQGLLQLGRDFLGNESPRTLEQRYLDL